MQAAHERASQLAETYRAPEPSVLQLPGEEAVREAADAIVAETDAVERFSDVERAACAAMLELFTSEPASVSEATQMRRERDTFVALLRNGIGIDERMKAVLGSGGQRPATEE